MNKYETLESLSVKLEVDGENQTFMITGRIMGLRLVLV